MSLHDDLVSVVIPVYNSEKFLRESIESVLNQTFKNIEVITIDDGSTDKSLDILQQFSDKITIISQPNQGLAVALNAGIKKIHGKWFKWFSPDDILYPNAIEILVEEASKLPDNTIIYSNWELIDEENNIIRLLSESNYNNLKKFEFNVRLLDGQQINVNTTLIPTSLLKNGCLFQNLEDPVAIDYDFFLRSAILFNSKFHLIEKILLKYRIHPSQLSHKSISETISFLDIVRKNVLSEINQEDQKKYLDSLDGYQKNKPLKSKAMEFGYKFSKSLLPDWVNDKLLIFYVNKIRKAR